MDSNNSSTPTSTQGSTPTQDSASPSVAMPDQSSAPIYEPTPVQAAQSLSTSETDVAPTQETTPGSASGAVENVATAAPADLVSTSTPNVASAPGSIPTMTAIPEPVSPVYQPNNNRVGSTDPIMMPEPAQGPDPIEEELRAPMQAADPVPGSIGSAVSGAPSSNTPNVAFNDPAMQTDMTAPTQQPTTAPTKKKTSRATLILLIVIASIIVVALAVILVMQLTGNGDFNFLNNGSGMSGDSTSSDNVVPAPATPTSTNKTLSCTRNLTLDELVEINDAVSGTVSISAEFTAAGDFETISLVKSVVYNDDDSSSNEPVETEVHETMAEDLTSEAAMLYDLPVNSDGTLDLSLDGITGNYEDLAFVCEVL